jgi:hypothetical protein
MSKQSAQKRQKERNRQEWQRDKASKKEQRKVDKANKPPPEPGVDPDIAHIIPGPQPLPEEFNDDG